MPEDAVMAQFNSLFLAVSLIMGLLVGSFCNVCVGRWPHGESVVSPRSRCPKCMNAIAWYDNIPLLSWLILAAKCRHCKAPISWQYPVVEAITGIAHSVGKLTVAEFVDRPQILPILRECAVDYIQGYFIGEPQIGLELALPFAQMERVPEAVPGTAALRAAS